jgi:hypothetical protein
MGGPCNFLVAMRLHDARLVGASGHRSGRAFVEFVLAKKTVDSHVGVHTDQKRDQYTLFKPTCFYRPGRQGELRTELNPLNLCRLSVGCLGKVFMSTAEAAVVG